MKCSHLELGRVESVLSDSDVGGSQSFAILCHGTAKLTVEAIHFLVAMDLFTQRVIYTWAEDV